MKWQRSKEICDTFYNLISYVRTYIFHWVAVSALTLIITIIYIFISFKHAKNGNVCIYKWTCAAKNVHVLHNRLFTVSSAIMDRVQIFFKRGGNCMKVWEILCMFLSNCSVLMMFSRIFHTIFTSIMKICQTNPEEPYWEMWNLTILTWSIFLCSMVLNSQIWQTIIHILVFTEAMR